MNEPSGKPLWILGLAACLLLNLALWQVVGIFSVLMCAPVYGLVGSRLFWHGSSAALHAIRRKALDDTSGRHFSYKSKILNVWEDDGHFRWVSVGDVQRVIAGFPAAATLARIYPDDVRTLGAPPVARIRTEALARYLEKSTDPESVRFKVWLERNVAMPARRLRGEVTPLPPRAP